MNNIKLKKDWDYGGSRIAKAGQTMRVDHATKKRLIEEGIAEHFQVNVEIITKPKPAKALSKEAKKSAATDLQKNS